LFVPFSTWEDYVVPAKAAAHPASPRAAAHGVRWDGFPPSRGRRVRGVCHLGKDMWKTMGKGLAEGEGLIQARV